MSNDVNESVNAAPPKKSGGKRIVLIFVVVALLLVAAPIVCCSGIFFAFFNTMKAPLDAATTAINADQEITQKLGSPIKRGSSMNLSDYTNENGNGGATVEFDVTGPNGAASVTGRMVLTAGSWRPENLTISCEDGTEFHIPPGQ